MVCVKTESRVRFVIFTSIYLLSIKEKTTGYNCEYIWEVYWLPNFLLLIPLGCREVRLHFERRRAVESSFRGPPATFQKHRPFGQRFLAGGINVGLGPGEIVTRNGLHPGRLPQRGNSDGHESVSEPKE